MDKVIHFQMSLFGAFINIQPNQELTGKIVACLQDDDFIPSVAVVNTVDPIKKQVIREDRLQMESKDHTWHIIFFEERIDINYDYVMGGIVYNNIESIIQQAKILCEHTFAEIGDTTGIRIAINGRFLVRELSSDDKQRFIKRIAFVPSCCKDKDITEWNIHFNSPIELEFGQKKEICNNIIEMFDVIEINSKDKTMVPRLTIGLDMSTSQSNKDNQFQYTDLLYFADAVQVIMQSTLKELEGDF